MCAGAALVVRIKEVTKYIWLDHIWSHEERVSVGCSEDGFGEGENENESTKYCERNGLRQGRTRTLALTPGTRASLTRGLCRMGFRNRPPHFGGICICKQQQRTPSERSFCIRV